MGIIYKSCEEKIMENNQYLGTEKVGNLFDYIKALGEADLDRLIRFVLGLVSLTPTDDRPACPHCGSQHVTKNGHVRGKQRFVCHECSRSFSHTTNTLMAQSHYQASVWADFIRDTLDGESLDSSAEKFLFRTRLLSICAIRSLWRSGTWAGSSRPSCQGRRNVMKLLSLTVTRVPPFLNGHAVKHANTAQKPASGISNEYVAICTGIQRDGGVIAETVNRAKPSGEEPGQVFRNRIARDTLFSALCTIGKTCHWHGVKEIRSYQLVIL